MPFCNWPVETWDDHFLDFDELMSRTRFKRRVDFVKRRMAQIIENPLFLEIGASRMPFRVERSRKVAMVWRERLENPEKQVPKDPLPPVVFANGGSSLGNRDLLIPDEYPIQSQDHSGPTVRFERQKGHLRCRPAELYLGALMRHKKLEFFVYYDGNVFDERIVRLWVDEAKAATLHYLTTESIQCQSSSGLEKSKL